MRLIDADEFLEKMIFVCGTTKVAAMDVIDELPTIEPCEDAISIEVAIQTTWMILNGMGYPKDQNEELDQTIKAVFNTAPRVAPSRPSGEWIITEQDNGHKWTHRKCSECGKGVIEPLGISAMKFCPNCGAQMKGANNESI